MKMKVVYMRRKEKTEKRYAKYPEKDNLAYL